MRFTHETEYLLPELRQLIEKLVLIVHYTAINDSYDLPYDAYDLVPANHERKSSSCNTMAV